MKRIGRRYPSKAYATASDGPGVALWSYRSQQLSGSRCLPKIFINFYRSALWINYQPEAQPWTHQNDRSW